MRHKTKASGADATLWWRPILRGSLVGLATILLLFILLALLLSFGLLPLGVAPAAASVAMAVGGFFAGLTAAKKQGQNGLLVGAACGAGLFLLFTLIGLAAFGQTPGISTLIRLIIFVVAGAIGGIIGVGSANQRKIV